MIEISGNAFVVKVELYLSPGVLSVCPSLKFKLSLIHADRNKVRVKLRGNFSLHELKEKNKRRLSSSRGG